MAGALTHILAGLLLAIIIHLIHFRLEFSLAAFLGNLLPDAIKFGISGILYLTVNLSTIIKTGIYPVLQDISASYVNWLAMGFFILVLLAFLYHFHVIKKKTMKEYDELYAFLIMGVALHLILDYFVQEVSPWI